jgi:hypothetical protein
MGLRPRCRVSQDDWRNHMTGLGDSKFAFRSCQIEPWPRESDPATANLLVSCGQQEVLSSKATILARLCSRRSGCHNYQRRGVVEDREVGSRKDFQRHFAQPQLGLVSEQPFFRALPQCIDSVPVKDHRKCPRLKIHRARRLSRSLYELGD